VQNVVNRAKTTGQHSNYTKLRNCEHNIRHNNEHHICKTFPVGVLSLGFNKKTAVFCKFKKHRRDFASFVQRIAKRNAQFQNH